MITTTLSEEEIQTLVNKIARFREELVELGASAVVISASFSLLKEDKTTGHSYTWASEGNHFEIVGLLSTTLDRVNRRMEPTNETDV